MTTEVVLDSSAVLAYLQNEPGGETALAAFTGAVMSSVNYAEVITKLIEWGATADEAETTAEVLALDLVVADAIRCVQAGRLHARTKRRGVSIGDRFCLALAEETGLPVLTADRGWTSLDLGVEVRLIR
jgi:ribonuclease VapC